MDLIDISRIAEGICDIGGPQDDDGMAYFDEEFNDDSDEDFDEESEEIG